MKRMATVRLSFFGVLCSIALFAAPASAQDLGNKQVLLGQARGAYYNLRDRGLVSFQCNVSPNWDLLLQDQKKQDPDAAARAMQTLNQLHFTTSLAADNTVTVTHNDLGGQSPQMMSALSQIYGGMEQMASGFFDTWKLFMLSPPFPDTASQYTMESLGPQYRLSYKEGSSDVVTTMGQDFAIAKMQVNTATFRSSILPTFTRTEKGLRLSGYEADYQSQKPEEATHLKVALDYQEVEGLSLVQKLNLSGSYGGALFAIELTFSGCQVTKK